MLDMKKLGIGNVWKIVKTTRLSFLTEHSDQDCNYYNPSLLSDKNIQYNKGKCYTNATFGNCLTKVKVKNSEILGSFKLPLLLILFLRWDSIFRISPDIYT